MKTFQYHRPDSLDEATALLDQFGEDARVLAGGQSLLNMMKWRLVTPAALIDVNRLTELQSIGENPDEVAVGALTRYSTLADEMPVSHGAIHDALAVIADIQVRNLGTLGGSCCQADPFGDMPNVMVALNARLTAQSRAGSRDIAVDDFFRGPLQTALRPDEMLCHITLPLACQRTGSAYEKFSWRRGDYAIISVAAVITVDGSGRATDSRLVAGGLGLGPFRLKQAERAIKGHKLNGESLAAAAAASREAKPESDRIYGSADYKHALLRTVTERVVTRAWSRANSSYQEVQR